MNHEFTELGNSKSTQRSSTQQVKVNTGLFSNVRLRSEKESEIGLTQVAGLSSQWRRPISPQAINTNNRHSSPASNLDE